MFVCLYATLKQALIVYPLHPAARGEMLSGTRARSPAAKRYREEFP
jgi:hypothetical protein